MRRASPVRLQEGGGKTRGSAKRVNGADDLPLAVFASMGVELVCRPPARQLSYYETNVSPEDASFPVSSRRMWKSLLLALGLVLLAAVLYGAAIEPRFLLDRQTFEAEIPALPAEWEGKKVAMLADFQIGMWLDNVGMAEKAVAAAIEEGVALVLIGGDFVYSSDPSETNRATVEQAVQVVRPLVEAGIPVVAVLGNHDYSLMTKNSDTRPRIAEALESELRAVGVIVLENDAVAVPAPEGGGQLHVAGIGSVWAENSRPADALAAVPSGAPRLVLMHNPESYRDIPAGEAPLALAAHTHGGQIRLLGPTASWLDIVRQGEVVTDGWAPESLGAAGNRLYVNRGIGFSTLPIRINCRPELTLVTLRRAEGTRVQRVLQGPGGPPVR